MIPGFATTQGTARFAGRHDGVEQGFYRLAQGLTVSSLGIGTYLGPPTDERDELYEDALREAVLGGVNVIDTAINYRHMRSERAVGRVIAGVISAKLARRDELLVCTKAGFLTPGAVPEGLNRELVVGKAHSMAPEFIEDQLERSRENLRLKTIDVLYLHNPEFELEDVPEETFERRVRDALTRLEMLCAAGKIRHYGMATWSGFRVKAGSEGRLSLRRMVQLAREAGGEDHRFRFIQMPVSLGMPEAFTLPHESLAGEPVSVLEVAARNGITVMASASLMQARLASGLPEKIRGVFAGPRTDAQFAIQFARSTPGITTALAGMSRVEHVRENLGAKAFPPAGAEEYMKLFDREA